MMHQLLNVAEADECQSTHANICLLNDMQTMTNVFFIFLLKYVSLTVMFPVMSMLPHMTGHEDIVSMVFLPEDPGTKNYK